MSIEEKIVLLEELMDLDKGTLTPDVNLEDVEEWVSLSKLSLIAEAKHTFHLSLRAEQLKEFKTIQDICDYLQ